MSGSFPAMDQNKNALTPVYETAGPDWTGSWIGQGDNYDGDPSAAPLFACDFTADLSDVMVARLYLSGLGIFSAYLNGRSLADTLFDPGESDAGKTVYYVTYDVASLLRDGRNTLGVILGNGQYCNFQFAPTMTWPDGTLHPARRYQKNDGRVCKPGIAGRKKLIAQLELTAWNGERRVAAVSGLGWRWRDGPVVFQNWYGGEDHDATLENPDWCAPEGDRRDWMPAVVMDAPAGKLTARTFPPIRVMEKHPPTGISRLPNGNWLIDAGSNGAGFPEIHLQTTPEMRGRWIRLYPAELLKADGSGVDQASCTQSWNGRYQCVIRDSYRIKGSGAETWHPSFCYHGFQYIEAEGWPGRLRKENVSICRVRTANEKLGGFRCSNPTLNRINAMVERSIESNMFGAFTDCPQIEKLGWIETSHLMFSSLAGTYDIRAWGKKILHDIADAQVDEGEAALEGDEPTGYVPAIVPEYQRIVGLHRDPNWNGACIFTTWEYYWHYGDKSVLEEMYPVMAKYLRYLTGYTCDGLLEEYAQMGDWGELGETTPRVLVATCAYYRMLRIMVQTADILHYTEDAAVYHSLAQRTNDAFHTAPQCYDPRTEVYGNGSQASYGCALYSGLVPEGSISRVVDRLADAVRRADYHLTSGEVGLKQVFWALSQYGRNDIVYQMVMNPTAPSYWVFADRGMTALPEYWNCDELWHGMARSRNHAMMGHVKEWLLFSVLGMKPLAPGFARVSIVPWLPGGVDWVEGKVITPHGGIEVSCRRVNGKAETRTRIPDGVQVCP